MRWPSLCATINIKTKHVGDGVLSLPYLTQQGKLGQGPCPLSANNVTN